MFVKAKRNYICKLKEDYSQFFLHPIKTLSLGCIIMLWPMFLAYIFYLAIFTNYFSLIYNSLSANMMTFLSIIIFSSTIFFIIWTFIPKMFRLIKFWVTTFKDIRKVPLMKIKYSQAKVLVKTINEFYAGNINILDRNKCIASDYYGVDSILGFYSNNQDENIVFVGDFLSTVLLINVYYIYQVKEKINAYGKKKRNKITTKRKRQGNL